MSNNLTDEQLDKIIVALSSLTPEFIDKLKYIERDYESEKQGRKATPSLIDLKISEYDEKLTLSLDKRKLEMLANVATITALNRVDKNLLDKIEVLSKANELLEKRIATLESDKKGIKWVFIVLGSLIGAIWALIVKNWQYFWSN